MSDTEILASTINNNDSMETLDGAINRLQLSGRLLSTPEVRDFVSGARAVKVLFTFPQRGRKARPGVVDVLMWIDANGKNAEAVQQALPFKQGDEAVINGKISLNYYHG